MGDPREPVPAADGLCAAVAAFREEPHPGRDAGLPARRLEGRVRAAGHRVRAVELSRQHRRRADRRHDGAACLPGKGPYRLSRGHRRCIECRRLRQRGRRHHDHHDVDRRREPALGARGLRRGGHRAGHLRHSGRAPAAPLFADRQRRAARPDDRVDAGCDRGADPDRRHPRQRDREPEISRAARHHSGDRASRSGL